jgi:hypothetical protein
MIVTKNILEELYQKYNMLYFGGLLGKCAFSLFPKNTTYLGWYCSKETARGKPNDRIWIGTGVYWTEETLKRVLIHEMVHMYVYRINQCKYDGILGHGRHFRKQARFIKDTYGIEVYKLPKVEYVNKKNSPKLWERIILWLIDR